jgi:hypothetical protein
MLEKKITKKVKNILAFEEEKINNVSAAKSMCEIVL